MNFLTSTLVKTIAVVAVVGDVFHVLPGKVHSATNNGSVMARVAAVFVAEKGKPLTTPVK